MVKEKIKQWINALHVTLLTTETELSAQDRYDSYAMGAIENLKRKLEGIETALNETTDDPTLQNDIQQNFSNSLREISKQISGLRFKPMPPDQIAKEFRSYHETNFNFIKPIMAQVPFGYSLTPDPENISQKIYKTWAIKNAAELNEVIDLVKDMFDSNSEPLDTSKIQNITPIYFVIHSN